MRRIIDRAVIGAVILAAFFSIWGTAIWRLAPFPRTWAWAPVVMACICSPFMAIIVVAVWVFGWSVRDGSLEGESRGANRPED